MLYRPDAPAPTPSAPTRAAVLVASVLAVDALLHLYWTTGATWPAADGGSLSHAVLGTDVPFTPPILLPLAALLLTAAAFVLAQLRRPGNPLLRVGTLAVAAGLSLRALAGVYWLFAKETGTTFHWLNLMLYTPLCAVLAVAALRVARWKDASRV
ncbi:DUF3995 domain-containing protein [Streptomyces sp. P9(2023)]|uniref:DUF3995 domain-containing protein n=1 Tax=Streptomyces sp. P9(2023) TaxID=3064394 RepID=UPI0028F3F492|nr:DUF3995 domain-containing protein [Streptomyces sp. P9(2023)]MDT9686788.1 DUF3995 domain-containing protein [Streptomyces sp. P9(2023)]